MACSGTCSGLAPAALCCSELCSGTCQSYDLELAGSGTQSCCPLGGPASPSPAVLNNQVRQIALRLLGSARRGRVTVYLASVWTEIRLGAKDSLSVTTRHYV